MLFTLTVAVLGIRVPRSCQTPILSPAALVSMLCADDASMSAQEPVTSAAGASIAAKATKILPVRLDRLTIA
jgi:hypothetical protein